VNDINITSLDCVVYKAFSLSGTAYIPTSFYHDRAAPVNRVYGIVLPSIDDICGQFGNSCVKPVIVTDDIVVAMQVCVPPELGDVIIASMAGSDIPFNAYDGWVITEAGTSASVYNRQVTMSLHITNALLPEDPEAPDEPVLIDGDVIAVIGAQGRPATLTVLNEHNSNMPGNSTLLIDTNGLIRYYGYTTTTDETGSAIELNNLNYNI
jgi:hypothetical protein